MTRKSLPKAILIGGLIGGALDLAFAVSFAFYNGTPPSRVFQTIASGLLGDMAFTGGNAVAVSGVFLHFSLSILWAFVFAIAAWRLPALSRRPVFSGVAFGLVVFLCMRLLVLPLSAYPYPISFEPLATSLDLLSHILLFGIPIVVIVSRAIRTRRPGKSLERTV